MQAIGGPFVDIFYPVDEIEVTRQMFAFFSWAWAACYGWRFANWQLKVFKDFFQFLYGYLRRS